tara:strand:- start:1845 stop:2429 length:585 start_codon:yes stop_codon:yes gene_type:complete
MASLLERLDKESPAQLQRRSKESLTWFRNRVRRIRTNSEQFYKQSDLQKSRRFLEGRMFTFFYDPKTKDKLPYYDTFPCVMIVETYGSGFLGLNIHYLPPRIRIRFLEKLFEYTNNEEFDETTRIRITWNLLSSVTKLRASKAAVKRYLYSHVEGSALLVEPKYWDIVSFLPTASFSGASMVDIYRDTRNKIDG